MNLCAILVENKHHKAQFREVICIILRFQARLDDNKVGNVILCPSMDKV